MDRAVAMETEGISGAKRLAEEGVESQPVQRRMRTKGPRDLKRVRESSAGDDQLEWEGRVGSREGALVQMINTTGPPYFDEYTGKELDEERVENAKAV